MSRPTFIDREEWWDEEDRGYWFEMIHAAAVVEHGRLTCTCLSIGRPCRVCLLGAALEYTRPVERSDTVPAEEVHP